MLRGLLTFLGNVAGAIGKWFDWRERQDHMEAGRNEERLKGSEAKLRASREMRGTENEVEGLPDTERRELARKWVRGSSDGDEGGG